MKNSEKEPRYMSSVFSSFAALWRTKDALSVKNIRKSHLQYFLILPILLALVNMQNNYLRIPGQILGLDSLKLMYISYCAGIVTMLFINVRHWGIVSRLMAGICVCGIFAYIYLPHGNAELFCALACWIGVGGLMAFAMYVFAFILNNTERLFGLLLAFFSHGVFMIFMGMGISNFFLTDLLPGMLTLAVAICVFLSDINRFPIPEKRDEPPHPSIWLAMIFFAVSFLVDSTSSFLFTQLSDSYQVFDGIGIFAAIIISVIIQIRLKHSVWHLWNLFFIVAFLAHLLTLCENTAIIKIAFFLHGVIYIGYVAIVYTIGGINKKYGSIALFRKNLIILFGLLAPMQAILGYAQNHWPQAAFLFSVIACGTMLFVFLLLSPLFQRHLFLSDWMDDYYRIDMSPAGQHLQSLKVEGKPISEGLFDDFISKVGTLTRTERELFQCYKDGKGTQEILACMYISLSTFKTHNSHIFQKLGISSRDELLLYIDLIRKSGKASEIEF